MLPLDPSPSLLWTRGAIASCEARFVPNGVETRIMRNGSLLLSQVFPSGEAALESAEKEKARTLPIGWDRW
jgi:hypothetical protein